MILLNQLTCIALILSVVKALQFPGNPTSDVSDDDHAMPKDVKNDHSEQDTSELEIEAESKGTREKQFLDAALKTVLDPDTVIMNVDETEEEIKHEIQQIQNLPKNVTLENFLSEMDNLTLEICKTSQEALWSYITEPENEEKKSGMLRIAAEDDEVKSLYWTIWKTHYTNDSSLRSDPKLQRKFRIVKERGIRASLKKLPYRMGWNISAVQHARNVATVCKYNTSCSDSQNYTLGISDIQRIFKTSSDPKELSYYWKEYRDQLGQKLRSLYENHIFTMNHVAKSENFNDVGEMWRFAFDDEDFVKIVERVWGEVKPLYNAIHSYVRRKLKAIYKDAISEDDKIPEHLLGNLYAHQWQDIYKKIAPYPDTGRFGKHYFTNSKQLFDIVDEYHKSIGFESANDSYKHIDDLRTNPDCIPTSQDFCDGMTYRIQWCNQNVTDDKVTLTKAARLLGHVQYFKHYRDLEILFRDGPNPAFHDALADLTAIQVTAPKYDVANDSDIDEVGINHLLWLGLDKLPLMGYAYVFDKWRWDVFAETSFDNDKHLNERWWELRSRETGITPPEPRNESYLDSIAKYQMVSDVPYIKYLVSNVLEFQILKALCEKINHTGPLYKCSMYGSKEAGKLLSHGMSLGASASWRTVLKTMTGESDLSTVGLLQFFSPLEKFLISETSKILTQDMDASAPIIVGSVVVLLTLLIVALYCVKKHNFGGRILSLCGLSKNGSLDIATNEMQNKGHEMDRMAEAKA